MVFIAILIKADNIIQKDDKCSRKIVIDNQKTVYDYLQLLVKKFEMAQYNAYMFENKCLGYDIPITSQLCSIFGTSLNVHIKEVSFTVPNNPFKHINWILMLFKKNLFDIINLEGDDPINKQSIGTWHTWGKLPHLLDKDMDNHPLNLVIVKDNLLKIAYNKHKLKEFICNCNKKNIVMPHNSKKIPKELLVDQLQHFDKILPIITI